MGKDYIKVSYIISF